MFAHSSARLVSAFWQGQAFELVSGLCSWQAERASSEAAWCGGGTIAAGVGECTF